MDTKKRKIEEEYNEQKHSVSEKKFSLTRKIIERLGKEEILNFLTEKCLENISLYEALKDKIASKNGTNKVFVRSIDFGTTEEAFYEAMSTFGEVESSNLLRDKESNKPRGIGFVTFKNFDDAFRSLEVGEVMINDRIAYIHFAQNKGKTNFWAENDEEGQEILHKERKIFCRNLGDSVDANSLRKAFEVFGPIESCIVPRDQKTRKQKGYGFVTFFSHYDAAKSVEEMEKEINGVTIKCDFSKPQKPQYAPEDFPPPENDYGRNFPPQRHYAPHYHNAPPQYGEYYDDVYPDSPAPNVRNFRHQQYNATEGPPNLRMRLQELKIAQAEIMEKMSSNTKGGSSYPHYDQPPLYHDQMNKH